MRMFRPVGVRAVLLVSLSAVSAQAAPPAVFAPRGSGGGGALFAPSYNPANGNELFISCDMSELFRTTDLGGTWAPVDFRKIQGNRVSKVHFTDTAGLIFVLDVTDPSGSGLNRIRKSTDGGTNWTTVNDPTGGETYAMAVDPATPANLLLVSWNSLYVSANGGSSWTNPYNGVDSGSGLRVAGTFFDGNICYLGTNDGVLKINFGVNPVTAVKQAYTGITAGEFIIGFAGAKNGATTRFLCSTSTSVYNGMMEEEVYWDSSFGGLYTLDLGGNWVKKVTGVTAGHAPIWVGMAAGNISTLYAGGGQEGTDWPVVYKSVNAGTGWTNVFPGTGNPNVITGWAGTGGDRDWSYGGGLCGFAVCAGDVNRLAFTDYGFCHVSTDGGANWKQAYVNAADQNPAGANTPKNKSYHSVGLENTTGWSICWADANTLISCNSDIKGMRSTDAGASWGFGFTGHSDNSMYRCVKHPTTGVLYAAVASVHDMYQSTRLADSILNAGTGKVLFSTDKGATWQNLGLSSFGTAVGNASGRVAVWVELDPTNTNRLYAAVAHSTAGGIFVCNNIGSGTSATWTKLSNPARTQGHPFNIRVLGAGELVVSYSGRRDGAGAFTDTSGVFYCADPAASPAVWADRSHANMHWWTKDVVIDPHDATQNTWYACVFSGWGIVPAGTGGLYRSVNRGVNWTKVQDLYRVGSVTVSPTDANEAYLSTEEEGLWYSSNLTNASPTFTQVAGYPFRQPERILFNPHDPTEIWVTSFGNGLRVASTGAPAPAVIQFASASVSVNEGVAGGKATVTIVRSGNTGVAATVQFSTANGTAVTPGDYGSANQQVSFGVDETEKTVEVSLVDDTSPESDETVQLKLTSPGAGAILGSTANATLTIVDNDTKVQFSAATYSVNENAGTATILINRVGNLSATVSVTCETSGGSASPGTDYTAASQVITFTANQTQKSFVVTLLNDSVAEGVKTIGLNLINAVDCSVGTPGSATLTVNDTDALLAPTNLTGVKTGLSVQFDWTDPNPNEDGTNVQRRTLSATGTWSAWATIATVGPGVTTWTGSFASNKNARQFRVTAFRNDGRVSPASNKVKLVIK